MTSQAGAAGAVSDRMVPHVRTFSSPHSATPRTQLLSNGRYAVMFTAAGSGYSHWRDLAITRWREDVTRDNTGSYTLLRDVASGQRWSAGFQPNLEPPVTGWHGLLNCYEAFIHVVNKKAEVVRVYLPPDANCLLSVMDHCLRSRHYVNVVIAGKHPAPQWLAMHAAVKHCTEGIGIWQWASNDQGVAPDVVMACCGDVPTLETLAAVSILREHLPELEIRNWKWTLTHE